MSETNWTHLNKYNTTSVHATRQDNLTVPYLIDMIRSGEKYQNFRLVVMQFQFFAFLGLNCNAISAYYESLPAPLSWDIQMQSYWF
jgi:hypothetical protein